MYIGLRKRLLTLLLQYIKTPTFNPEVARLLKVPQDPLELAKNIYYCQSCEKYLKSTEFPLSTLSTSTGRCRQCLQLDNRGRARQDLTQFRYMVDELRKMEDSFSDGAKIAFLLQEADVRYLVEKIWGSQSALSAATDLYDLVLVRWDRREEWSPWNTLLLSRDEAAAHLKVSSLQSAYCNEFVQRARRLHTLAKTHYGKLPALAEHLALRDRFAGPQVDGHALPTGPTHN